ncbi:MAG: arsenate reductase (glutaredoxin) [Gammaproteobacteria bacterium]|nr:arsenate reductase (glutaredoxin) [Gammaproteobacteria bacterium]
MNLEIYHNPHCSKSRKTLSLIEEKGIEPKIIRYLETPPDRATLEKILDMLNLDPRDLMRQKEVAYKEQGLDNPALSREQLIEAMIETPKIIERPIVIKGNKAILGRPPENVLDLL